MTESVIFHLSFPGGGGLFPLLIGKALRLRDYLRQQVPEASFFYSGISSGTFVALFLALNLEEAEINNFMRCYLISPVEKKWYIVEQFHFWYLLKRNLRVLLGRDGFLALQGRYRVGISTWNRKAIIIDQYNSSEDVINAILASAHLALLGRQPLRLFHNQLVLDGGFTCDHIQTSHLPSAVRGRTVTFRVGYETFDAEALHFQQAMPLFTQAKWDRMLAKSFQNYEECVRPLIEKWMAKARTPDSSGTSNLFSFAVPRDQEKESLTIAPDFTVRTLAKGSMDVIGGYTVWGLWFTWRFILNNPF